MSVSLTLPDGGDAIGLIVALLLLPLALTDDRTWHWRAATGALPYWSWPLASVTFLALRAQIAFIYLDAGITKMGVTDWANGSAEYYILRDPTFGASGPVGSAALWLSDQTWGTLVLTWGGILLEVLIGTMLLCSHKWRRVAWVLDLLLHVSIIATMGLVSFATIMMGAATTAANPAVYKTSRDLAQKLPESIGPKVGDPPTHSGAEMSAGSFADDKGFFRAI